MTPTLGGGILEQHDPSVCPMVQLPSVGGIWSRHPWGDSLLKQSFADSRADMNQLNRPHERKTKKYKTEKLKK